MGNKLSNDNDCADVETGYSCIGQSIPVIQYEMFLTCCNHFNSLYLLIYIYRYYNFISGLTHTST